MGKAYEQGERNGEIPLTLGKYYIRFDPEEGKKWLNIAAFAQNGGSGLAMMHLGDYYAGHFLPDPDVEDYDEYEQPNPEEAVKWYKMAEEDDGLAEYRLGECYEEGFGVEKDLQKAVEYYKKATDKGCCNRLAPSRLGECYAYGIGVEQDDKKAAEYYKEASFTPAIINLGICYARGKGVERDPEAAEKCFRDSAKYSQVAKVLLAVDYAHTGQGEPRNPEALKWWREITKKDREDNIEFRIGLFWPDAYSN